MIESEQFLIVQQRNFLYITMLKISKTSESKQESGGGGKRGQNGKKKRSDDLKNSEERLQMLQQRFDDLTLALAEAHQQHKKQIADNEWLQNEIARISGESSEYSVILERRANKRQTMIVSLSDQHAEAMREIRQRKADMLEQFSEAKKQLGEVLVQQEALLLKKRNELAALQAMQSVKDEQEAYIARLKQEVQEKRQECTRQLEERKRAFFVERQRLVDEAKVAVATRERQARREAEQLTVCLAERTRDRNKQLRTELNELLRRNQAYHEAVRDLSHQCRQLTNKRNVMYGRCQLTTAADSTSGQKLRSLNTSETPISK